MSSVRKPVVAICYDFDGTLSPCNMQEFGFFHGLGKKERKTFWNESNGMAKKYGADQNLMYMKLMIEKSKLSGNQLKTTRSAFRDYGKDIEFFKGVGEWFSRINKFGKSRGVVVEHYIISSGLKEMVEGSPIGKFFKKIYACSFYYDNNDVAAWPAQVVNGTSKTQYLFRINKGIEDDGDTETLNAFMKQEDRRVPFSRMMYFGDGATDIPCMRLVKDQGGYSFAVFNSRKKGAREKANKLFAEGRVNYVAPADYADGSLVDKIVKGIIEKIVAQFKLDCVSKKAIPSIEEEKGGKSNARVAAAGKNKRVLLLGYTPSAQDVQDGDSGR